jgi:hypothetical protein
MIIIFKTMVSVIIIIVIILVLLLLFIIIDVITIIPLAPLLQPPVSLTPLGDELLEFLWAGQVVSLHDHLSTHLFSVPDNYTDDDEDDDDNHEADRNAYDDKDDTLKGDPNLALEASPCVGRRA